MSFRSLVLISLMLISLVLIFGHEKHVFMD
jgi:hypothetical protein